MATAYLPSRKSIALQLSCRPVYIQVTIAPTCVQMQIYAGTLSIDIAIGIYQGELWISKLGMLMTSRIDTETIIPAIEMLLKLTSRVSDKSAGTIAN